MPLHAGGVPTASRVQSVFYESHNLPYFRLPFNPFSLFRSFEHLFSFAIESQSQQARNKPKGFLCPRGLGVLYYIPHTRAEKYLQDSHKPANPLNRLPIKFDNGHALCECPACPPALALPQTHNRSRPRSTSCVTAKRNNRSNWITHMFSLKLRLKSLIGAVVAVVHTWYWEDSIVMEWESRISILAE